MPIESNDAEDNEEREGDFYSHAHTWSFLLVQPIVAWKVLANKRHLEPTLRFELRDPQFKDPQFTKLPLLLDSGVFRVPDGAPYPSHCTRTVVGLDPFSGLADSTARHLTSCNSLFSHPADGPLEDFTNRKLMQLFSPEMKRLKGWLGAGGRAMGPGASAVAGVTFCTREFHVVPRRQIPSSPSHP